MVQVKYEMVRTTREDGPSVTAAATAFGLSRQSCYQAAAAREEGRLAARPGAALAVAYELARSAALDGQSRGAGTVLRSSASALGGMDAGL